MVGRFILVLSVGLILASAEDETEDRLSLGHLFRSPCRTDKRFCVALRECPVLLEQVRNRNPGRIFQYLRDFTFPCHMPGYVCCPARPWTNWKNEDTWTWPEGTTTSSLPTSSLQPTPPSTRRPKTTTIKSTEKHKNRRLLPEDTCGLDFGQRVLGGIETELEEHPWLAVLRLRLPDGREAFICGGSIISTRYILTAAHCLHKSNLPRNGVIDIVRVGEHNLKLSRDCNAAGACNSSPQDIGIESTIIHPNYAAKDPGTYDDIALIRLKRDIQFNLHVQAICLPLDEMANKRYEGQKLTTVGWGKTSNAAKINSPTKQKVQVPVLPSEICAPQYRARKIRLRDTQICAGGEEGKDSCQGDSGGPLMATEMVSNELRWFIQGIVSTGPKDCGKANDPALYTRVGKYVKWILDNLRP